MRFGLGYWWLRGIPLLGEMSLVTKGLPSSARRWDLLALLWYPKFFVRFCSQNFDHCHLFASLYHPLGALRLIATLPSYRRSWKNKLVSHNKKKNTNLLVDVFFLVAGVGFASLEPPDKQWVSTVYPTGNLQSKFSPNSNPLPFPSTTKRKTPTVWLMCSFKDIFHKVLTGLEPNGYISLKRAHGSTFIY